MVALRQNLNQWVSIAVAGACFLAIAAFQAPQIDQLKQPAQIQSIAQLRRGLSAEALQLNLLEKLPTFGFNNLVADWTFLNFVQYFGDEPARLATDYRLSPEYFDVIIDRDPYWINAYPFLSTSTTIYGGQPERAIALIEKGLRSLTPTAPQGSYIVWRNKAIDELLFLGDAQAAQKSFNTAADWAETSSLPGSQEIAVSSRQTAQFLATNPDSKVAQVSAWIMVLTSATDDRSRRTAVDRIQALGGEISIGPDGRLQVQLPQED